MKIAKKILSIFLVVLMLITVVPVTDTGLFEKIEADAAWTASESDSANFVQYVDAIEFKVAGAASGWWVGLYDVNNLNKSIYWCNWSDLPGHPNDNNIGYFKAYTYGDVHNNKVYKQNVQTSYFTNINGYNCLIPGTYSMRLCDSTMDNALNPVDSYEFTVHPQTTFFNNPTYACNSSFNVTTAHGVHGANAFISIQSANKTYNQNITSKTQTLTFSKLEPGSYSVYFYMNGLKRVHIGGLTVTNHSYNSNVPAKAATCQATGYRTYKTCSKCSKYYEVGDATNSTNSKSFSDFTTAKLSHSHTGAYRNDGTTHSRMCVNGCNAYGGSASHTYNQQTQAHKESDATCTAKAKYYYTCVCGAKGTTTYDYGNPNGHSWNNATCTAPKTCKTCGATEGSALNHSFTNYVSNNNATCTANGTETAKCDRCDATDTREDADSKLPHTEVIDTAVPATCTTAGKTEGKHCSECNTVLVAQTEVPATGHTFEAVEKVDETCTEGGYKAHYTCTVCNKLFETNENNLSTDYKELDYFAVGALNHDYEETFTVDTKATCEANGSKSRHCTRCSAITDETVIEKREHVYVDVEAIEDATCVKNGTMKTKCSNTETDTHEACSSESTRVIDKTGHNFKAVEKVDETCTEVGYEAHFTCETCKELFATNEDVYSETYSTLSDFEIPAKNHDMQKTADRVDATCTEDGKTAVYTCANGCGHTEGGEVIGKTGHNMVAGEVVAPECEKDGYTVYTCANSCGHTENRDTVPATDHKEGEVKVENNVNPNCVNPGSYDNVVYCTECNKELSRETVDVEALGHSFTKYKSNNDATCLENGTETAKCDRCDETHTRVDDESALGHTYGEETEENLVKASCFADGSYDVAVYCTVCKTDGKPTELSRETKTIPQRSHVFAEENEGWYTVAEATYFDKGEEKRDCQCVEDDRYVKCDHLETREIPMLIDKTAPTGSITYDKTTWDKFLEAITFGIYVSKDVELTIEAIDNESGVDKIEYIISGVAYTEDEVEALDTWTEYSDSVKIPAVDAQTKAVYVKITDKKGNATYINTNEGFEFDLANPVIEADVDCTSATITVTDKNLVAVTVDGEEVELDENGKYVLSEVGTYNIVATDAAGNEATKEVVVKGHAWKVKYSWSEDGKACTATRVCGNDEKHNITVNATVTSEVTTPATCEGVGTTTYTATFEEEWAFEQTTTRNDVPAINHAWTVEYSWSKDGKSCTATRVCGNDEKHNITVKATVTSEVTTPATCEDVGTTTYTATFEEEWAEKQTTTRNDVPAINHNYDIANAELIEKPVLVDGEWTEGKYQATCLNDNNHKLDLDGVKRADYSEVEAVVEALKELAKYDNFTDSVKAEINEYIEEIKNGDVVDLDLVADYTYGDVTITGQQNVITKALEEINAKVKEFEAKKNDESSTKPNFDEYKKAADKYKDETSKVNVSENDKKAVEEAIEKLEKIKNNTDATENEYKDIIAEHVKIIEDINNKYAVCVAGTHNYADATCTEPKTCKLCGSKTGEANGHVWGEWKYDTEGKHKRVCKTDASHYEVEDHSYNAVVTPPTCTTEGFTTHTCAKCGNSYVDTNVNALGHTWGGWVLTTKPTKESNGEYTNTCSVCKDTDKKSVEREDYSAYDKAVADAKALLDSTTLTDAAKSEIRTAIEEAEKLNQNLPKDLVDGEKVLVDNNNDETISSTTSTLNDVVNNIKNDTTGAYEKVDYTAYNTAINAFNALDNVMTDVDKQVVKAIKAEIAKIPADGSKLDYQTQVNKAVTDITALNGKYDGCAKDVHAWNTPELTKDPTADTKGEYTETCTICGATQITKVDLANYEVFDAVVEQLEELAQNEYLTDVAKKAVADALKAAENLDKNLPADTTTVDNKLIVGGQSDINTLVTELTQVVTDTNESIADGSALKPNYDAWELAEKAYTDLDKTNVKTAISDEVAKLMAEIAEKQADKTLTQATATQERINEATARLNTIIAGIEDGSFKNPDYSKVEAKLETVKNTNGLNVATQNEYEAIKNELEAIQSKAPEANAKDDQAAVDDLEARLNTIIINIGNETAIAPDFDAWNEALGNYNSDELNKDNVKEATLDKVAELKETIETLKNDETANKTENQQAIDEAVSELNGIIEGIENGTNKDPVYTDAYDALTEATEKAKNNNVIDGVKEDIQNIEKALDEIKNNSNTNANDQDDIDALEEQLKDIIAGIENGTLVYVDLTAYETARANYEAVKALVKDTDKATVEAAVKSVTDKNITATTTKAAGQETVDEATKAIEDVLAIYKSCADNVHDIVNHDAKAPTCTEIGWNAYDTCNVCTYTTYEEIAATGHSYEATVTPPTCTADGYTTHTCHCGDTYVDTYVDALGHKAGEVVVENNVAPDCVNTGSYDNVTYCTVCSVETSRETVTVDALGHTTVVDKAVDPTCTATGLTEGSHCSVCSKVLVAQTVVDALGHKAGEVVVENNVAPDCVNTGSYDNVIYCTVCSVETSRETITVDALGHTTVVDKAVDPTCTATGLTEGSHCSVCSKVLVAQTVVDALGHKAGEVVVENNVAPDCVNTGSYDNVTYCTVCSAEISRETVTVDALGHIEVSHEAKAPTCIEDGWKAYVTCQRECGYTTYTVDPAPGHNEVVDKAVAATCTETGLTEGKHCSVCSEVLVAQTVVEALGHKETALKGFDSTCTSTGLTDGVRCSVCREVLVAQNVIPVKSHKTEKLPYRAPTCSLEGLTEGEKCSVCGTILVEQTPIEKEPHVTVKIEGKASTCTSTGLTDGEKCTVCNEMVVKQQVIEKAPHAYKQFVTKATCEKDGYVTRTCSVCLESGVIEVYPATGHNFVNGKCTNCDSNNISNCGHLCHKTGFLGFIWKIVRFFLRLFNINKTCSCGMLHYEKSLFGK